MAKSPDLLTAMAKRLRVVEERNRMLSLAVTEKDRELHELRTELLELRGGRSENRASETAVGEANSMDASYSVILIHVGQLSVTELKKRNAALEKQVGLFPCPDRSSSSSTQIVSNKRLCSFSRWRSS